MWKPLEEPSEEQRCHLTASRAHRWLDEEEVSWERLFERAREAGLDLDALRGITSDGANGLIGCLIERLAWVNHQRCVWYLWRNLGGRIAWRASRAAMGLESEAAETARKAITGMIHRVLDAPTFEQAEAALGIGIHQPALLFHPHKIEPSRWAGN